MSEDAAIPMKPFGRHDADVSALGFGGHHLGDAPDVATAIRIVQEAVDSGITFFDNCWEYHRGKSEDWMGQGLKGRRDKVFLMTKVCTHGREAKLAMEMLEQSLRRLQTDHLDLYLLHWESSHPIAETMRAMEHLIDQRLIRYTGVSNFDVVQVKEAQAALRHHRLAANQVLYHLRERGIERKLIPYCAGQQIAVVAYTPFGKSKFRRP